MRSVITAAALLAMAMPLAAQQQMGKADPTNAVKGTGQLPAGWMMRFDPIDNPANVRPGRTAPPKPTPDMVKVSSAGSTLHFTSGPAAIYYNSKDVGSGVFSASATFTAKKSMQHEAYGIFIGGSNLQDSTQSYLYFEIRPGMGDSVLVQHRNGDVSKNMDKVVPWTSSGGLVNVDDPADGHSTNTLMIHVAPDSVHFIVNGKLVKGLAKSDLKGAKTDGLIGIRINHNSDLDVEWKGVGK